MYARKVLIAAAAALTLAGTAGVALAGPAAGSGYHRYGAAPAAATANQAGYRKWTQDQMKTLQQALISQGFDIQATGSWGAETRSAIAQFQKKKGLRVTGFPNQETRKALGLDW